MNLVCVTGIDGAGKTTLARNIAVALRKQGRPAVYVYGRIYPVISRLLMALGRITLLRRDDPRRDYGAYIADKKRTMCNPLLAWPYTAAVLLDYYIQIWFKLLRHRFSRRIVVSDRYIYDTVISDLTVHLNYSSAQTERAIERGLRLLPMPMLTILIDLPEEVAFSRKTDVPHIDYLRERRGWYLRLIARPEVDGFDGAGSPESLLQASLSRIIERLAGGSSP
jgi:thymidylate kinase